MCSASSIARLIEATVASMLTTTPFLSPFDGWDPIPMMSMPSSVISPTMAQILVVPMSRPTRMSPLFAMSTTSGRVGAVALRPPFETEERCSAPPHPIAAHHRPRRRQPDRHPRRVEPVVEVEHLRAVPLGAERREHLLEPGELRRQVARSEPDLRALLAHVDRRAVPRVDVDLRQPRGRIAPVLAPGAGERERAGEQRLHGGAPLHVVGASDPGHERQV